jgi:hypothetical protein
MNTAPFLNQNPEPGLSSMISGLNPSTSMERVNMTSGGLSYMTSGIRSVSLSSSSGQVGGSIKVSTGSSLNSIAPSPGNEMVVVGGREILKIFSTGLDSQEILNLRVGAKSTFNLNSNDVAWGNGLYKNMVVSAAASGTIVLFDLSKSEKIGILIQTPVFISK